MGALENEDDVLCPPRPNPLDIDKEWRNKAETELNETPEQARENMKKLARKLAEDKTLNSRMDEIFLMAFLRGKKHDVDAAYKLIRSYYEMKHNYPNFYKECLPSEKPHLYEMGYICLMPGRDKYGCNLCTCIPAKMDFSIISLEEVFQLACSALETALMNPEMQISGISVILDLKGMSLMQQARLITPRSAWQITNCIQEKIPVRIKAIHILNQPVYFNALYAIFKPFLKSKLRKRLHLHGSDMASLHEFVSTQYLPPEWGGTGPEYNTKAMTRMVTNNEHNLLEWKRYGVIKKK